MLAAEEEPQPRCDGAHEEEGAEHATHGTLLPFFRLTRRGFRAIFRLGLAGVGALRARIASSRAFRPGTAHTRRISGTASTTRSRRAPLNAGATGRLARRIGRMRVDGICIGPVSIDPANVTVRVHRTLASVQVLAAIRVLAICTREFAESAGGIALSSGVGLQLQFLHGCPSAARRRRR